MPSAPRHICGGNGPASTFHAALAPLSDCPRTTEGSSFVDSAKDCATSSTPRLTRARPIQAAHSCKSPTRGAPRPTTCARRSAACQVTCHVASVPAPLKTSPVTSDRRPLAVAAVEHALFAGALAGQSPAMRHADLHECSGFRGACKSIMQVPLLRPVMRKCHCDTGAGRAVDSGEPAVPL